MCGIIGYSGGENALPILLDGLKALEYRGYDSAGVAVICKNAVRVVKTRGKLESLTQKLKESDFKGSVHCGIGHTRWATHGEPSDLNSHPHGTGCVCIVHNGIIENYASLKSELIGRGAVFSSDTDTEAAALLIDDLYRKCGDPVLSLIKASDRLVGSYAIAAVFRDFPGKVYAMRRDSPLIVALSDKGSFIASDIPAFLKYTNRYIRLDEGEIAVISENGAEFFDREKAPVKKRCETAAWTLEEAEKGGYAHFMLKEIHEEPYAVSRTVGPRVSDDGMPLMGIDELSDEKLAGLQRIHIVACGTAMHAGLVGKNVIEKLAALPTDVEISSEFRYKDPILFEGDLVIVISQSGETADTLGALRLAKSKGAYTLAIVNVIGSSIAREADGVIYTYAGPEIAVASTKAYTVQMSALYMFAIRLAYAKGKLSQKEAKDMTHELLYEIPKAIEKALTLEEKCAHIAKKYVNSKDIFFIGRGLDYAMCLEASLKLKEISYIHCEAYAAGEMKHGTISLIEDGVPVFALATSERLLKKTLNNVLEVRSRGASIILAVREGFEADGEICDDVLYVPAVSELFMPFPVSVLLQLIAYHFSLCKGNDVDKPRNLAKSVTVE